MWRKRESQTVGAGGKNYHRRDRSPGLFSRLRELDNKFCVVFIVCKEETLWNYKLKLLLH